MKGTLNVNPSRVFVLKEGIEKKGPVVYWMQRDQRVNDNWAFLFAQELAIKKDVPLYVAFCLYPAYNNAPYRHYYFMISGLREVETELEKLNIPFLLLYGEPEKEVSEFVKSCSAGALVTDFNPVKKVLEWKKNILKKADIPVYEVDAHNIVPCRIASNKEEFGAYTIRPKINKLLDLFLEEFPSPVKMKESGGKIHNDWKGALEKISVNTSVDMVKWIKPGESEAINALQNFVENRFAHYGADRNNPAMDASSNLSPYFHFGQLAPQRAALTAQRLTDYPESQSAFLEELIIRRELAENFCFYNKNYDSFEGFRQWGKDTLNAGRKDKREFHYTAEEFERGQTHDPLWNAAQREMVIKGKMHGYLRMYWAKKILEWSPSPEDAIRTAIYLNDKYELDGRDPNGYTGIAWSIGGIHDRAWGERPVFGKIRYMNYNGCKRKFDVDLYIEKINNLDGHI